MVIRLLALASIAALAIAPAPLLAQPKDEAAAKQEFEAGRAAYLRGDYEGALPHLRRAYTLSGKRPSTIRALAQCERALGSYDDAIALLREYLALTPPPEDQAAVEKQIAELERRTKEHSDELSRPEREPDFVFESARPIARGADDNSALTAAPEPAAPASEDSPALLARPWFWILTGAAVAAGGTALALALSADRSAPEPYGGSTMLILRR